MIDLRSDTVTTPSEAMRRAASEAPVGDDVYGDDPSVNDLQRRAADRVGMEAALYVPSGTMGNQIAARVHTERGQEILLDEEAHLYKWELGGLAQHAQLQTRTVDAGERCVPTPEQIRAAHVEQDLHRPGTGLLALENTHNSRGGVAVPPEHLDAAAEAAQELGVPVHLDGARLFNACVALDVAPERMTENVDSVMFCLSKGLGAPVGSILAGPEPFVERARRVRKLFGGGMRQAGMIAAPGRLALENVADLAADHERAARLAAGIDAIDGLTAPAPDTNIVVADAAGLGCSGEAFERLCGDHGVAGHHFGPTTCRFTTHRDLDDEDIEAAIERLGAAAAEARR